MAPANRAGYALLPTVDIAEAGGPVRPTQVAPVQPEGGPERWGEEPASPMLSGTSSATGGVGRRRSGKLAVNYDMGRRFDLSAGRFVIHPHTPRVQAWFYLLTFMLFVDLLYLPLETAFGRYMSPPLVFWLNATSTTLFSADMVLHFFLQVPSSNGEYWVFNHGEIFQLYLRGFFAIDFISVLPLSEVYAILQPGNSTNSGLVLSLQLLRNVKLLRLLRFWRMNRRYTYEVNLSYATHSILSSGAALLVSIHVMSCLWATLADYQTNLTWLEAIEDYKTHHGHHGHNFYETDGGDHHPIVTYICAVYFALYTLTGVGYGDITPTTVPEFLFCSALMVIASLIWAMVIGEIVNIMQHASHDEMERRETMDTLITMGEEYQLPQDLRHRLRNYFKQRRVLTHTNFLQEMVLAKMSSEIAVELVLELHGTWLENVWWLKDVMHSRFMVELAVAFDPALYCPREQVKATDRLHVVRHGLCMHGTTVLTRDQCWGLDCMLVQGHLRRLRTTIAISYLHLLFLKRDALNETLDRYPLEKKSVRKAYRCLCLMRGMVYRASLIKAEERRTQRLGARASQIKAAPPARAASKLLEDLQDVPAGPTLSMPVTPAAPESATAAIQQAQERISRLEAELGDRMAIVERQVRDSLEAISAVLARRAGATQPNPPLLPASAVPARSLVAGSGTRGGHVSAAAGVGNLLD